MKIVVSEALSSPIIGKDSAGRSHEVTFTDAALKDLIFRTLGSPAVQDGSIPQSILRPKGTRLSRTLEGVGVALYMTDKIAMHVSLPWPLFEALKKQLLAVEPENSVRQ
jgi:hypothetical protein